MDPGWITEILHDSNLKEGLHWTTFFNKTSLQRFREIDDPIMIITQERRDSYAQKLHHWRALRHRVQTSVHFSARSHKRNGNLWQRVHLNVRHCILTQDKAIYTNNSIHFLFSCTFVWRGRIATWVAVLGLRLGLGLGLRTHHVHVYGMTTHTHHKPRTNMIKTPLRTLTQRYTSFLIHAHLRLA